MNVPLRVLIVNDKAGDADRMVLELRRAGFDPDWQRVESERDYLAHLSSDLHVILAACSLPGLDAARALALVQQRGLDIPLIVVGGAEDAEAIVRYIKQGAADYIAVGGLGGLGQAVIDALDDKRLRDEKRRQERWLQLTTSALEQSSEGMAIIDLQEHVLFCNRVFAAAHGYDPGELVGKHLSIFHTDDQMPAVNATLEQIRTKGGFNGEVDHVRRDGTVFPAFMHNALIRDADGIPIGIVGTLRDISEHKQAETALRAERDRAQRYLDVVGVIIIVLNVDQTISLINRRGCEILGCDENDIIGQNWFDKFVPKRFVSPVKQKFAALAEGEKGDAEYFENPIVAVSGEERIIAWHNVLLRDESGSVTAMLSSGEDVTERRAVEAALRESEERYRHLVEDSPISIVVHSDGKVVFVNPEAVKVLGAASADDILGHSIMEVVHPDDREVIDERIRRVYRKEGDAPLRTERFIRADGESIDVEVMASIVNYYGHPAAQVVFRDISERRRAEDAEHEQRVLAEALRDTAAALNSSLALDQVLESILENVGRVVPHTAANIMLVEDDYVRIVGHRGYSARFIDIWMQEQRWSIDNTPNLRHMANSGQPLVISDARTSPSWVSQPETDWIRAYAGAPIRFENRLIGFLNLDSAEPDFFTHIHAERLQAFVDQASVAIRNAQLYDTIQQYAAELEQRVSERTLKLQDSEARYRAIVEDQTELVCRFLPDGTLTFVNRAYCRYFDSTSDDLVGQNFINWLAETDRALVEQLIDSLNRQNPVASIEHRVTIPDGSTRWLQWTNRVIVNDQGEYVELQAVGRDVTERHRAEEMLRKSLAREMELGELKSRFVSMVSHEFRTPLSIILMNVDILEKYSDRLNDDEKTKYMENVHASIRRMTELLDDVLTISRAEMGRLEFRPEPLNIGVLCQNIVDEIRTTASPELTFRFETEGVCRRAVMDKKLLRLILSNLVSNAAKYSLPGGTVWTTLACTDDQVVLRIRDEGIGIPERDQPRLFETFFRAENVHGTPGTGLGLTIAKQCVEYHRGTITFDSREGVGTTFTVILPRNSVAIFHRDGDGGEPPI